MSIYCHSVTTVTTVTSVSIVTTVTNNNVTYRFLLVFSSTVELLGSAQTLKLICDMFPSIPFDFEDILMIFTNSLG